MTAWTESIPQSGQLRFREFHFDFAAEKLYKGEHHVPLQPLPTQLLALFLNRPGELISRETIHEALWTDRVVEYEQSLNFCVRSLRRALNDDAAQPHFIETVPRRGYRFVAPVEPFEVSQLPGHATPARRIERWVGLALIVVTLSVVGWYFADLADAGMGSAFADNPPVSPAASENYLKGRFLLDQNTEDSLEKAIIHFERALANSNEYADAHAALAVANYRLSFLGAERMDRVRLEVRNALSIDPDHAEANLVAAFVTWSRDYDLPTAEAYFQKVLQREPGNARALHNAPLVAAMQGDLPRALAYLTTYSKTHPGEAVVTAHSGWFRLLAGDVPQALSDCEESVRLDPRWRMGLECLANAQELHGQPDRAEATFGQLRQLEDESHQGPVSRSAYYSWRVEYVAENLPDNPFELARAAAASGDEDTARALISSMAADRHPDLTYVLLFPEFERLRTSDWFWDEMHQAKIVGAEPIPAIGLY